MKLTSSGPERGYDECEEGEEERCTGREVSDSDGAIELISHQHEKNQKRDNEKAVT
jgi:hypothetical protein